MKKVFFYFFIFFNIMCIFNGTYEVNYHDVMKYLNMNINDENNISNINLNNEYDNYVINDLNNDGFEIFGSKKIDLSSFFSLLSEDEKKVFSFIDMEELCEFNYSVNYYTDENIFVINCSFVNNENNISITDEVPAILVMKDDTVDAKILIKKYCFNEEGYFDNESSLDYDKIDNNYSISVNQYYMSEIYEVSEMNQRGFFNNMIDALGQITSSFYNTICDNVNKLEMKVKEITKGCIDGISTIIKPAITTVIKTCKTAFQKKVGINEAAKIGADILNMEEDSNGIYHANFNCWQKYVGYNDFYDFCFNLGTSMDRRKFSFYDENGDTIDDLILWGWKGDYLNLGAGMEMGIYKRFKHVPFFWYVCKEYALNMSIKLEIESDVIFEWDGDEIGRAHV